MDRNTLKLAGALCALTIMLTATPCHTDSNMAIDQAMHSNSNSNKQTVNSIINNQGKEITAIANIVGIYAGLLEDQHTECIKVLVTKKDQETERQIYNTIKGVPVVIEQTGPVTPLNQ